MVQTFLIDPNPQITAQSLDIKRLRSTLNEASGQIYPALLKQLEAARMLGWSLPTDSNDYYQFIRKLARAVKEHQLTISTGWWFHPAVLMWFNNLPALCYYLHTFNSEYQARGFPAFQFKYPLLDLAQHAIVWPEWYTNRYVYASHQYNLFMKAPFHYLRFYQIAQWWQQHFPDGYLWPRTPAYQELFSVTR